MDPLHVVCSKRIVGCAQEYIQIFTGCVTAPREGELQTENATKVGKWQTGFKMNQIFLQFLVLKFREHSTEKEIDVVPYLELACGCRLS